MILSHVQALVAEGRMEWVAGERTVRRKGVEVVQPAWIPVARFIKARTWRKTISDRTGAGPMACMQLVS